MEIIKKEFKVLSSDNVHMLAGVVFLPAGEARGFFHIVHGMTEYMGRYEKTMRDLAEEGWICFGYDNLGHGRTANNDGELGYIAGKRGWELLVKDVKVFSDAVMAEYPAKGKKLPYCLMGHSMGSFIARLAAERYVKPDRLIIMGTGGANPAAAPGLMLIGVIKRLKGDKHISKLIAKLAFGGYNKRFENELSEAPSPWLTTDSAVRNKYKEDRFCTFKFTVSAMGDLIRLMKYSNRGAWFRLLPKDVPVLLVSGKDDPVGNYGKGVLSVYGKLKKRGQNVRCVLYEGARHEILNDFTYEDVKKDIMKFCGG